MKGERDIILKMPKNITIYYFVGMIIAIFVGIYFTTFENIQYQSIGFSIIGGGIVGIFAFSASLITRIFEEDQILLNTVRKLGITGFIKERSMNSDEYKSIASKAENYDLIGFGLGRFRKDMRHNFENWAKHKNLRILVINPNSDISTQRDREEFDNVGKISNEAIEITRDFLKLTYDQKIKKPLLKWYNAIPSINIQRFDSVMYIGPYFVGKKSIKSFALRLEKNSILYDSFKEHFDEMWSNNELTIDPSFVESFPKLLEVRKKYWENKVYFLVGATYSGKSTALEFAKKLGFITVDWSNVLEEYFKKEGVNEYHYEDVVDKVKEKGIHYFPLKVMNKLIDQYINGNGKAQGFVIAGARNYYELFYLSTFFEISKCKTIIILASDEERFKRFCIKKGENKFSDFLYNDDKSIIESLNERFIKLSNTKLAIIDNSSITKKEYEKRIKKVLAK